MKQVIFAFALAVFAGCKDNKVELPSSPTINYYNLQNSEVDYNTPFVLDINRDGINDFHFIATYAEGTGNGRLEFTVVSEGKNLIFSDYRTPKVFYKYENIPLTNAASNNWTMHNPILITRIFSDDPANTHWEGAWKGQVDKYLGVKVKVNNNYYTGWVRITYSTITSKIIINDCAVSRNAGFGIQAGATN